MIKLFCAPHARSLASHIKLEEAGAPYTVVRVHFAPRILSVSLAKSPS